MGKLEGKIAIVTGAGSGFGRATSVLFAKEGAKVVAVDIAPEPGEKTVNLIQGNGGEATFVRADVAKTEEVKKMVKKAVDVFGKLDILFNNAGVCAGGKLTEISEEQWNKTIAINLKGVWLGMKYGIPEMLKTGGGVIINTASISGMTVLSGVPADYNATKAGVIMLTRTAAVEFAPQIRVNCICPGHCLTEMTRQWLAGASREDVARVNAMSPLGRMGTEEEIAQAALFLAGDETSSYITGEALVIDGGHTIVGRGEI
jgi:meso-butanediol dehydrogenase/(S,S)-butanediol dehydrogenase/diacetyl reductase